MFIFLLHWVNCCYSIKLIPIRFSQEGIKSGCALFAFIPSSSSLDLSFEDDSVADEKIPFLAYLASVLKGSSIFLYESHRW